MGNNQDFLPNETYKDFLVKITIGLVGSGVMNIFIVILCVGILVGRYCFRRRFPLNQVQVPVQVTNYEQDEVGVRKIWRFFLSLTIAFVFRAKVLKKAWKQL